MFAMLTLSTLFLAEGGKTPFDILSHGLNGLYILVCLSWSKKKEKIVLFVPGFNFDDPLKFEVSHFQITIS